MEKTAKGLESGDRIRYRDLKDLQKLIRMLNHEGYGHLVDFGSRTVHITAVPGEEEKECSKDTKK